MRKDFYAVRYVRTTDELNADSVADQGGWAQDERGGRMRGPWYESLGEAEARAITLITARIARMASVVKVVVLFKAPAIHEKRYDR